MLRDLNDLVKVIRRIVVETLQTTNPMTMVYGTVVSIAPLKILVEQKITLDAPFLMLSKNVTNYNISLTLNGKNETARVNNALKIGEQVILLRQQGGQKFLVVDRVVNV